MGITLSGLPAGRSIVGATLSGPDNASWAYRTPGVRASQYHSDAYAGTLEAQSDAASPSLLRLLFKPQSKAAGAGYTATVTLDDGSIAVVRLTSQGVDLGRLSAQPTGGTIVVSAGVDLNRLAKTYARIELSPGTYILDKPLLLERPIAIVAPYGNVTLRFQQSASSAAWSSAIKIHSGNTTLEGFSIRFSGGVRWNHDVSYGAAVIGTTDNLDATFSDAKANLTFRNLDIEGPPAGAADEPAVDCSA